MMAVIAAPASILSGPSVPMMMSLPSSARITPSPASVGVADDRRRGAHAIGRPGSVDAASS